MAQGTPGDFRLYHSNALEVLAGILAEVLRAPVAGQPLLAPDVVLIPQVAMRRWLQASLAARHGVVANIDFLTPGEFVARALEANLGPADRELDADTLRWHLYAALGDRALLAQPAMAAIAAHLDGGDPLRAWSLAGELAAVFEAARGGWPERRLVVAFQPHRYSRTRDLLDDFAGVLSDVDALVLTEVYPAGEQPLPNADARALARAIRARGRIDPVVVNAPGELREVLPDILEDGDLLLVMGAGDIGQVPQQLVAEGFPAAGEGA